MRERVDFRWLSPLMLALVYGLLMGHASASPEEDFAQGVAASRRQQFATALRHFEAAEKAGMREPLLYYNLGVCYYRQGSLDQAARAFREAARSPRLAAQSYYNLGLIARDQGERDAAIGWFMQAAAVAQSPQMKKLSANALYQMTGDIPAIAEDAARFAWIEAGVGYDNNAALAADLISETGDADRTWGFSAYGLYDFQRLRLHAALGAEHYFEENAFDFDYLETGLSLPAQAGAWKIRPGLSLRYLRLGGASLQNSGAFWLETATVAGGYDLKLYLEHETVSADAAYEYLDGTRHLVRATAVSPGGQWRTVAEAEFNKREDLTVAAGNSAEHFSFSPARRQLQFEYRKPLTPVLNLKLAAGLQTSRYSDPDVRIDQEGAVNAQTRRDDRRRLILEFGYRHSESWRSRLEMMLVERNSNFEEFSYDRGTLSFSLGRSFGQ